MRWGTFVIVAAAVSCNATPRPGPSASRWPVQRVLLVCEPTALNFDARPGADGFRAQVLAFNLTRGREKALWLDDGELEIFLYDGIVVESDRGLVKPLQTWTFSAEQLLGLGTHSQYYGVVHTLELDWTPPGPSRSKITIAARYRSGLGEAVDSSLVTISKG